MIGVFAASTASLAADLNSASPPPAPDYSPPLIYSPVPVKNWSGFSFGIIGDAGFGRSAQSYTDNSFSSGLYKVSGGLIGVHAGLDYQSGNWVWGLGEDAQWASIKGSANGTPPGGTLSTFSTQLQWMQTGYLRVGYSIDRFLPYIVAGPAFGGVKVSG